MAVGLHDRGLGARIGAAVRAVEPSARVLLFGSRARGDAGDASDWDVLVLLDGPVDATRRDAVERALYDLELETSAVITALIEDAAAWERPLRRATPLYAAIARDGIAL